MLQLNDQVTAIELASYLIRVFEGCKLTSYKDSSGVWTIGYGHTGPDVQQGTVWTQQKADDQLLIDEQKIVNLVKDLTVEEAGALISFGYNCGIGALTSVLNGHATLMNFIHDKHGKELPGLVERRGLEECLVLLGQRRTSVQA